MSLANPSGSARCSRPRPHPPVFGGTVDPLPVASYTGQLAGSDGLFRGWASRLACYYCYSPQLREGIWHSYKINMGMRESLAIEAPHLDCQNWAIYAIVFSKDATRRLALHSRWPSQKRASLGMAWYRDRAGTLGGWMFLNIPKRRQQIKCAITCYHVVRPDDKIILSHRLARNSPW